jgi:alanine-glyoxylate transaminase/serine-glyoxylate transaminase/serine-pyruvate transaminase
LGILIHEFLVLMNNMQAMLKQVMQTENPITLAIAGTGSASMEAAFANMLEPDDEILICINGYFGHRMVDMAQRYGAVVHTLSVPWGKYSNPSKLRTRSVPTRTCASRRLSMPKPQPAHANRWMKSHS